MTLSKKDFGFAIITGGYTGLIAFLIAGFLGPGRGPFGLSFAWLIVIVPLLWIAGIRLGYFLGRWLEFLNQFGKFATIGFTNFAVDSGVLYLLIAQTGIAAGAWYSVFKTISFLLAVTHSYFWNKYWVFEARGSAAVGAEAAKFFAVNVLAAVVNVTVASIMVNLIPAPVSPQAWAGAGAVVGSAVALIVSFIGFRVAVFKR